MASIVQSQDLQMIITGLMYTAKAVTPGVAAGAETFTSILTGNQQVIIVSERYGSSKPTGSLALYEVAASGGTLVAMVNRNLSSGGVAPATIRTGATVTPNTPILATNFDSGVNNSAFRSEQGTDQMVLKPNTMYVIGLKNTDSQAADLAFSMTLRGRQLGEI
jgi:hypothetical protein